MNSFSKLSVTSPTSQLILQPFRRFTYVTAHSPTLPLLHLRHSSFSNPSFASSTSQVLHLIHLPSSPWRRFLKRKFHVRWTGTGVPFPWPPQSPDLNLLNFTAWNHLKSLSDAASVQDVGSLRNRTVEGCEIIRNSPGTHKRIRELMQRRYDACLRADKWHFEIFMRHLGLTN